ncbi:Protein of unknown function VcgC/VcgE [Nitrosomonas sp. Nm166]|nr:Protein of unknown function VcgC/VcgE [Nitrosomonas sp. Nm166]
MKKITSLSVCSLLSIVLFPASYVHAVDLGNFPGATGASQKITQALQAGEATTMAISATTSATGLTRLLIQQLGVTQLQAEAGTGALFQLAKSRMSAANFTALSNLVPDMSGLLAAAPAANPIGGGGMAGTFLQLGLVPEMVQKFIPIILRYVEESGENVLAAALKSALMGGM